MDDRRARMVRALLTVLLVAFAAQARADWPGDASHYVTLTPGGHNNAIQSACPDGIGGAYVLWGTPYTFSSHVQHLDESGRPTFIGGALELTGTATPWELASDGSGGAVMLLRNYVGTSTDEVQLQRLNSNGSVLWTTSVGTTPSPNYSEWTRVVFDPSGLGWFVAWLDMNEATARVRVQSVDWYGQPRWGTVPTLELPVLGYLALGPVAPDGQGGVWASCWDETQGRSSVAVQHVGPGGIAEWGPTGVTVPVPLNGWIQQLAGDSQRNLWLSLRANEPADLSDRIQRLRPDGSASFGANGIVLPHPEHGKRREAALGVVGPDRVFAAWTDAPTGVGWTTQLQALDSSGTWLGATRQLRRGWFGEYLGIRVYPLADGGAYVTVTPGLDATVPVQRVDADGAPQWPEDTSIMNVSDAMVSFEAQSEPLIPPFPTGDGGIAYFRTLKDSAVTPEEQHPNYVRAQHLDANGQHSVPPPLAVPPHPVTRTTLSAPAPSPMTSSSRVQFTLESDTDVELTLHDLTGRQVRALLRGRQSAGEHSLQLTRGGPTPLRPGLYWLRLTAGGRTDTRKLVVLD